jgi:hypothetical protein
VVRLEKGRREMTRTRERKSSDPELAIYDSMLRRACADLKSAQARALDYALYAGRIGTEIKSHLKTSTSLLNFKQFLKRYVPELPQRTANQYETVYKQGSGDSTVCYSSISEVLKAWRKDHPARRRFTPPTIEEKSRELLAASPSPDLPEVEKFSMGMAWWLDSPEKHEVTEWVEQHGYIAPTHLAKQLVGILTGLSALINKLEGCRLTQKERTWLLHWVNHLHRLAREGEPS